MELSAEEIIAGFKAFDQQMIERVKSGPDYISWVIIGAAMGCYPVNFLDKKEGKPCS